MFKTDRVKKRLIINMLKPLKNENGLALVTALMLGVIGMLLIASLILMTDSGTWLSGSKKRYQMALDAAYGGMEFFTKEVIQRGLSGTTLGTMGTYGTVANPFLTTTISDVDFTSKLTTTGDTTDGVYPNDAVDITVNFDFPSAPNITVNSTIERTARGNSGTSSNLLQGGGVVNNQTGAVTPMHIPYLYQTLIISQDAASPENATLRSMYAY